MDVYIISEIGINHNGRLENCFKMIDMAKEAACQAVKFQSFSAKNLYPKSAGKLDWKDAEKDYSYDIYEAVKSFEMPKEWIDELITYCKKKEIDFISSVFDIEGLDLLVQKGMERIKLSSYTITNIPLIEACAKTKLPIIMSTGGSTLGEMEEAIRCVQKYHNRLTVLHCSIKYPTELKDCNMGVLDTIRLAFPELNYGYSDHTLEVSDAPMQAVYLGATCIEKHSTLDKKMSGPDHFFALEPHELKKMVEDIKQARIDYEKWNFKINKTIYGNTAKICYPQEQYLRDFAYMALYAKRDIGKGGQIKAADLSILRPGKKQRGLEPKYLELFEKNCIRATKEIAFEDPILWSDIL